MRTLRAIKSSWKGKMAQMKSSTYLQTNGDSKSERKFGNGWTIYLETEAKMKRLNALV